jgi:hypothetical protein
MKYIKEYINFNKIDEFDDIVGFNDELFNKFLEDEGVKEEFTKILYEETGCDDMVSATENYMENGELINDYEYITKIAGYTKKYGVDWDEINDRWIRYVRNKYINW